MSAAVEQVVARWGRLDVLVSNAATMPLVPFAATTPELWNLILGVNLTGVYNGVRAAWPHLVRQGGGHCIAIASGASVRGFVDEVAYCAAKHGLEGFTKALAMEAEPHNIAVNTMGPGKRIKPTSVTRAQAEAADPNERAAWVDPLELAPAFVWLASQPPQRFTGLRFDAGPLADTIAAEGHDFAFSPEKVTIYPCRSGGATGAASGVDDGDGIARAAGSAHAGRRSAPESGAEGAADAERGYEIEHKERRNGSHPNQASHVRRA